MSAPDSTVIQVNFKTKAGSLLNIYATNIPEAKELIEAFHEELVAPVAALEQALSAASNVAAAGALAPTQPTSAEAHAGPSAQAGQAEAQAGGGPLCDHNEPMKFIPPGISKAGKPYKGFYACARPREDQCQKKVSS